jgi:1-acyl-sn-glycerol-3-phosphate acyltransferase
MDVVKSIIVWIIGIGYLIILFPITFIVWLIVLPFDADKSIIHRILTYQSLVLVKIIPIWKIKIEGREKAKKGETYVIISNHQSMLDTLFINSLRYRFKWVSKIENLKVPVLGWYLRMADYIVVNRGNEESKIEMLDKSLNYLKNGISVMLFPEGTRSSDNEVAMFKRGAFQLAIDSNVSILPVMIEGTGGILPKHGLLFKSGYRITVRVLDPVDPADFKTNIVDELAEYFRIKIASELKELRSKNGIK